MSHFQVNKVLPSKQVKLGETLIIRNQKGAQPLEKWQTNEKPEEKKIDVKTICISHYNLVEGRSFHFTEFGLYT